MDISDDYDNKNNVYYSENFSSISSVNDGDSDGFLTVLDLFPADATEWFDFDGDGTGNNADTDDDDDGILDTVDDTPYRITTYTVSLEDYMVLYFDFSEGTGTTAIDKSDSNNHGGIVGATWVADSGYPDDDGNATPGLSFDGTDDYIYIPHSTSLALTEKITISMWIKPATLDGTTRYLLSKPLSTAVDVGGTSISEYWFLGFLSDAANAISTRFLLEDDTLKQASGTALTDDDLNQWTHVFISYDATDDSSTFKVDTSTNVYIGAKEGTSAFFHGIIDEIKVYNIAFEVSE